MSEETAVADPETKEAALDAAASKADAADGAVAAEPATTPAAETPVLVDARGVPPLRCRGPLLRDVFFCCLYAR